MFPVKRQYTWNKLRSAKGSHDGSKNLFSFAGASHSPTETGNEQQCRRRKGLMRNIER
jgi:hypothetical protein